MEIFDSYGVIITFSIIIILSYLFNIVAKKTNIPSVLLLIITGVIIQVAMRKFNMGEMDLFPVLEVLGIVGLIMIVLEAALDLELHRSKLPIILRSFGVALLSLLASTFVIAFVFYYFLEIGRLSSLIYATPLAIISSAIIIPSVENLVEKKREFMVYEGTFSDILGIMQFYFLLSLTDGGQVETATMGFLGSLVLTLVISVASGYLLVIVFQRITAHVKLFLLISILLLLYSIGKLLHLSPLLIILIFGLMLANRHVFFRGKIANLIDPEKVNQIESDFYTVTIETAFLVRTFFFVIFGMTLSLASLLDTKAAMISLIVIGFIYLLRFLFLKIFLWKDFLPELFLAPRGLITILLFFAIPQTVQIEDFNNGILLYVIIISNFIMTFGLIKYGKPEEELELAPDVSIDEPTLAEALEETSSQEVIENKDETSAEQTNENTNEKDSPS